MKHLDEGTIHAWLDGALSEAEAREVSAHAASCKECGALVAEARGLIAGASRVLTSLDDVPAGIAPKRAQVVASAKPQRFWQAAPWVTGIAAALMLAIGVKEWRDRPSAKAAFAPVNATFDSLRASPSRPPRPSLVDSALRREAQPRLRRVNAPPAAEKDFKATSPASAAGSGGAGAKGPERADAASDIAKAQAELPKKDAVADLAQASAKVLPAAPLPAPSAVQGLALEATVRADERAYAGCYPLGAVESANVTSGAAPTRATAAREPAAERRMAPSTAASRSVDMPTPYMVRLDTTNSSRGRLIVSLPDQRNIGTWRLEGDSVRLMMPVYGVKSLLKTGRVTCPPTPERP
jgi:hypothetical protein